MSLAKRKGHQYKLVAHRKDHPEFVLVSYKIEDDIFINMQFKETTELLKLNDLLWSVHDMDINDTNHMLVVVKNYGNNKVKVKTPGNFYTRDLRVFKKQEVFRLVASFRKEGRSPKKGDSK